MGISKEAEVSIAASSMFPGFRFSPTDEELLLFYLTKKVDGFHQCVEVVNEVDICKHEPWDLPAKSIIKSDHEWFFFSPRGKKYPNGSQSKRATEMGYWKATGKERGVKSGSELIGTKRTLVFHIGRAPKGERTEWIMHEYCLIGNTQDSLVICRLRRKTDSHGTSWDVGSSNPSLPEAEGASSGSAWDPNRMSTEKAVQDYSKKCSSSNGSHSVEQNDLTSESGQKLKDEWMEPEPESSRQYKASNGNIEDDCFADILKDNIIELDESGLRARTNNAASSGSQQVGMMHPLVSQVNVSQGTANRRIRLKKPRGKLRKAKKEEQWDENEVDSKKAESGTKMSMRCRKQTNRLYVVMIMVAMLFIVLGSPWQTSFC